METVALEQQASVDPEGILRAGTEALTEGGDLQASRRLFDGAYRAAQAAGDPQTMALAALGLGGVWVHEHRSVGAAALLEMRLRQVLPLVEARSALGVRLRARLAGEADYRTGEHARIMRVLAEARRTGDADALVETLNLAHQCLLGPGLGTPRGELARELVDVGVLTGRRGHLLVGLLWQTVDLFLDAQPHAERRLSELRGLLAERDHLAVGFAVGAITTMLAVRAGRLDEAERLARACAERGTAVGDAATTGVHGTQLAAIRWYQGRLPELLPMLRDMVNSPTLSATDSSCPALLALAAAQAGDVRTATGALAALRRRDLADLPRSGSWLITMYAVVEAAHLLGDAEISARAYDLLLPHADLPMLADRAVACFGSVRHALGVASLSAGEIDRAATHLRAAIEDNLALGHWPAVTASRGRYAEALILRDGEASEEAHRELTLAAREAKTMGIAALGDPSSVGGSAEPTGATCVREGRRWRVQLGRHTAVVGHSVGLLHLAVLLANPGFEIPAGELVAGVAAFGVRGTTARGTGVRNAASHAHPTVAASRGTASRGALSPGAVARGGPSSRGAAAVRGLGPDAYRFGAAAALEPVAAHEVLDRTAVQDYRRRLAQLAADIDDFESADQPERAAQARAERNWIMAELSAATGIGGRTRHFADNTERARLAVGKAIRRAIARIAEVDPSLGEHLRSAVHTGVRCSYQPF